MRRRRAIASLGAAACAALLLSRGATPLVPLACFALIVVDAAWLAPRGLRPKPRALLAVQILLVVPFGYLALLRDPPIDFLTLLLVAAAPLIVVRSLHAESEFNDFLILLLSLLVVVGSAAVAPGALPIAITAIYVLVACQALKVLASTRDPKGHVRFRLEEPAGWWSAAPALAVHHLGMGGLLLGTLLYLLAPRPDLPLERGDGAQGGRMLGAAKPPGEGRTTAARSDFPREVRLGDLGRIKRRPFPALDVEIRARGRPYDPGAGEQSLLLLRARAWEQYVPATRRWEPPQGPTRPVPANGTLEAGETDLDWSFDVLGYDGLTLFLPPRSRQVRAAGGSLAVDRLGVVTSSVPVFQYAVASASPMDLAALVPDRRQRQLLLVPDAAKQVLFPRLPSAPPGDLRAAAAAVAEYFGREEFRYTLDLPPAIDRAADPLLAFLEGKEGNCELYATTACLFLRLMGVPARVAGGLRCADRIAPGRYRARFSNAHAWVEVPCEGAGYFALDFTPPDRSATLPRESPAAESEEEVGGGAGGAEVAFDWKDPFAYGPEEQERVLDWIGEELLDWPLFAVLAMGVLFLAIPPVVAGARSRRRSPLRVTAPPGQRRSTLAFYARWLRDCAGKGHARVRSQTPREFLAALPPELRGDGARITEQFERLRYGPPAPP